MIYHYGLSNKPRFEGDRPDGCVSIFHDWIIKASIFTTGFQVYKNSFSHVYLFSDLKSARAFIVNQFNLTSDLFNE